MFATQATTDLDATRGAVQSLRARLSAHFSGADSTRTVQALDFASSACQAAHRVAELGAACEIAGLLLDLDLDPDTVAAALINQALPSDEMDTESLAAAFGADVVELLKGLQRAGRIETFTAGQVSVESLRKMLLAIAEDVRVVLIKLAERTWYLRSLTKADDATRRAAALQTRDLFAPLANRLGVFQIKWELEDLSFRFLEPDLYKQIARLLDEKRGAREQYIADVIATLNSELAKLNIKGEITGRPKHIWSIHRKMQKKGVGFNELYDIRAVRVLVANIRECYTVLGIVHDLWKPIAGEFDDYIAQPKQNNYRSLHTAVIGPEGKTLEVQIRTHEMHRESEHGVAAHWRYKEVGASRKSSDAFDGKIAWLRQVLEWRHELTEAGALGERLRKGVFDDTVYVFTPQGRVVDLPAGGTPVDFAYSLHTELGHRCRGAKVNGAMVPLNTPLKNADRVEIVSAKTGGPSRDWLNKELGYIATHRAQTKVRQWFNKESFELDVATGRGILEKELQRAGQTAMKHEAVAGHFNFDKLDEFLAALGRGEVTPHQVEVALRPKDAAVAEPAQTKVPLTPAPSSRSGGGVLVLGVNNIATLVAKCCKPVPPDPIVGFVTRTRGVMVHRQNCPNITSLAPDQKDRLMPADWGDTGSNWFAADIEVVANDRQGLLRDITEAISRERVNVIAMNTLTKGSVATMRFTIQVTAAEIIDRVKRTVGGVADVETVVRR
ncbi:MAG: bifunctional (p)ppGpp synthetase/guanosine-3',5'-bis(diphosphate) 3'-pyrophosphohydrolase [Betaproteobacteria bacterium]|nr:bifunctional (p)ppGpp synthetase/guanosine-3',5'-bis(diphosphate) 3'-pyrophosphohydrolase [Betaproteobacteria bacterium]